MTMAPNITDVIFLCTARSKTMRYLISFLTRYLLPYTGGIRFWVDMGSELNVEQFDGSHIHALLFRFSTRRPRDPPLGPPEGKCCPLML